MWTSTSLKKYIYRKLLLQNNIININMMPFMRVVYDVSNNITCIRKLLDMSYT